jgi:hypothetical protein
MRIPLSLLVQDITTVEEKRRQNSRAPISRLPPEILSFIFSNIRDFYVARLRGEFDDVNPELWTVLTHVCHSWREIALGTPTLWTRVVSSPNNYKSTQEMLLRSKGCLLTCIIEGVLVVNITRPATGIPSSASQRRRHALESPVHSFRFSSSRAIVTKSGARELRCRLEKWVFDLRAYAPLAWRLTC